MALPSQAERSCSVSARADDMRNIHHIHHRIRPDHLTGGHKIIIRMTEDILRKVEHKIKNTRIFRLMFAEGFIIHKEVYGMPASVDAVDPS